jgi:hypothetical protein
MDTKKILAAVHMCSARTRPGLQLDLVGLELAWVLGLLGIKACKQGKTKGQTRPVERERRISFGWKRMSDLGELADRDSGSERERMEGGIK